MAKLNDKQKKMIIAEHLEGASYRVLAEKYHVDKATIARVVKSDSDFTQKATQKKKENTESVLAFMDSKRQDACSSLNRTRYGNLSANTDYAEKSKVVDENIAKGFGITIGGKSYGKRDDTYAYINNIGSARGGVAEHQATPQTQMAKENVYGKYLHMTPEEVDNYNYLYQARGKDSADEYLEYLSYELNERVQQGTLKNAEEFASKGKALASAFSVATNLMGHTGFTNVKLQDVSRKITGDYKPIDFNQQAMSPTVITQGIRKERYDHFQSKGAIEIDAQRYPVLSRVLNGKGWGDVYQLGMSMVDSGAAAALGSATGLGAFGTVILGGSAASQGVLNAVERGCTEREALGIGLANGFYEALFEFVSIDKLINGDTKNVVKAFFLQGGIEASEEMCTTIANKIAEYGAMGENSEWSSSISLYMNEGLSYEEAKKQTLIDSSVDLLWDAIGGFASGGISGGVKTAFVNTVEHSAKNKRDGTQAQSEPEHKPYQSVDEYTRMLDEAQIVSEDEYNTAPHTKATATEETAPSSTETPDIAQTENDTDSDDEQRDTAFQSAFEYGATDTPFESIKDSERISYLSEEQRREAYEAGQAYSAKNAADLASKNAGLANGKSGRKIGSVKLADDVAFKELNQQEVRATRVMRVYAEVTGVEIEVYRSKPDKDGVYRAENGKFDPKTPDKLYIDLNAGLNRVTDESDVAKYIALRTFSHEFTHWLAYWNPEGYNSLRKSVFEELTRQGQSVATLIDSYCADTDLSYEKASHEVVSESLTDILNDSEFAQRMATENKNLFQKILDKLKEFLRDLKDYFKTIGKNNYPGAEALKQQVGDSIHYVESIVEAFDKAAEGAVDAFQKAYAVDEQVAVNNENADVSAVSEEMTAENQEAGQVKTVAPESVERESKVSTSENGYTITDNAEHGGIEISFDEKPSEAVRDALKANKFRWHGKKKVWYGNATHEHMLDVLDSACDSENQTQAGTIKEIDPVSLLNAVNHAQGVANETGEEQKVKLSDHEAKQETAEENSETPAKADEIKEEAAAPKTRFPSAQMKNGTPSEKTAYSILTDYLRAGKQLTSKDLYAICDKAFGRTQAQGAYDRKDAYDAMELAVNKYLVETMQKYNTGTVANALEGLKKMQSILELLPTQNVRTEEQQQYQQFSTPPNIAYLAAWVANINSTDYVLEPSAGIGGLASFAKSWGAEVTVNELSKRRLEVLKAMGFDNVFNENAEHIDNILPENIKPSVVIMNPPFSSTAGRTATNKTSNAERHIDQALERLSEGGRLVTILGRGMSDSDYYKYWDKVRENYTIRANISIDGENYKKYGTTFDVQIVVIDKVGPQGNLKTLTGSFKDLTQIPEVLEGVRNDRGTEIKRNTSVQGNQVSDVPVSGRGNKPISVSVDQTDTGTDRGVERGNRADSGRNGKSGSNYIQQQREGNYGNVQAVDRNGRAGVRDSETSLTNQENPEVGNGAGVFGRVSDTAGNADGKRTRQRNGSSSEPARSGEVIEEVRSKERNDDGVFADYVAPSITVKGSNTHPAVLVESSAMSAVSMPKATYIPHLPENVIRNNLSTEQLVSVVYAGQAHEHTLPSGERKGFFIGDGTGVGKGRQISGIILDNFEQGRKKALWVSMNDKLFADAQRDWTDTTGRSKGEVHLQGKTKLRDKIDFGDGILFTTYPTLRTEKGQFSRINQIVEWLGKDFDGVIAFDEAHNMGNLLGKRGVRGKSTGSAMAIAAVELQKKLPNARVVYVSATAATEVDGLAFASRLGLWGRGTAFQDVNDFVSCIGSSGLAAMELVIRDMKAMGVYVARSISYNGVNYETVRHDLDPMQTIIYDPMSEAWRKTMTNVEASLESTGGKYNADERAMAIGQYYSAMQRFYNQALTSMSMPSVISDMKKELAAGRSCVLQIVNTNQAEADRQIADVKSNGGELDDMDLTPRGTLIGYLDKCYPVNQYEEYTDDNGNLRSRPVVDSQGNPVVDKAAVRKRDALIEEIKQMSIPDGPLEMLFNAFGTEQVAEITGRTRRVVPRKMPDGSIQRVEESRSKTHTAADVDAFQNGKKRILIFSDAGGTGKSYHASRTAKNQQQRVHYVLQPGWIASKAVQGFGRTHRSNQASAPIYKLVTTNIKGQKRFTSTIARRLDQLGALTKGQRDTGSGMFGPKDNLETDLARDSLREFYQRLGKNKIEGLDGKQTIQRLGLTSKFTDQYGAFKLDDATSRDISTFLNRILALNVEEQNTVFDSFINIYETALEKAISDGTLDTGMENVKADKIEIVDDKVIKEQESTGATTHYIQAKVYTKPKLITTVDAAKSLRSGFEGIYKTKNGDIRAVYRVADKTTEFGAIEKQYMLVGPNYAKRSTWKGSTFEKNAELLPKESWQSEWDKELEKVPSYNEEVKHMLTGTLLPIWNSLPTDGNTKVQRLIADDGRAYLGRVISQDQIDDVLRRFQLGRTKETYTAQRVMDSSIQKGIRFRLSYQRAEIFRSRVSGEWRLEYRQLQNAWAVKRQYPDMMSERIDYQDRFFIPMNDKGAAMLEKILEENPVVSTSEDVDDGTQYQARNYLDDEQYKTYSKKAKYSETETLFLQWENGSAPVGEVKRFTRFGKIRYYEKTENGSVELSRAQYDERSNFDAENTYARVQRQIGQTSDHNEDAERNMSGSINSNRNSGRASIVSGQTFGEELRSDTRGSISDSGGNSSRAVMTTSRIDYLIKDSGAGNRTDYAQKWITSINPTDFDDIQYQRRTSPLTDREVLSIAASDVVVDGLTDGEIDALNIFKTRLSRLYLLEIGRHDLGTLYKEQRFGNTPSHAEAKKTLERMKAMDSQIKTANEELLMVEKTEVLRRVLKSARSVVEQQERKRGEENLKRYRDRRNNAAAIKKYKDRITKDVNELKHWIESPDSKNAMRNVPLVLRNDVISFLTSIDFTSKRSLRGGDATKADVKFIASLNKLKSSLTEKIDVEGLYSGYNDLPPDFIEELNDYISKARKLTESSGSDFVINRMTADELKSLSKIVRVIKALVQQTNQFHQNAIFQHAFQAAESSVRYMGSLQKFQSVNPAVDKASVFLEWETIRPFEAFRRFGVGGVSIWNELVDGQNKLALNVDEIRKFREKTYTDEEVLAWREENVSLHIGGKTVDAPVSYVMGLCMLCNRPHALQHLTDKDVGGFRFATRRNGKKVVTYEKVVLTEDEVAAIAGNKDNILTERQYEVALAIRDFMAEQCGEWGNHVSVARWGVKIFGERFYYTIHSDKKNHSVNSDEMPENASLYALLNMSFTKSLKEGAKTSVVVYDIFDEFTSHAGAMAQYNALALPILDSLKWFNAPDVRKEMARAYGSPEETNVGKGGMSYAESFVINLIKGLNNAETRGMQDDTIATKGLHLYNASQVAFNMRVVIQQPLAIVRAGMVLDNKNILHGLSVVAKDFENTRDEMLSHSGIALWKSMGFYDTNISRGLSTVIKADESRKDKIIEHGMKLAELADMWTWAAIWAACKNTVENRGVQKDLYKETAKLFDDVIYQTQVVDSVLTKSQFLRSKNPVKRFTGSFMSESMTTASMMVGAYDRYRENRAKGMTPKQVWEQSRGYIIRAAAIYAIGAVLNAAVTAIPDAFRDDDEYQTWLEKWWEAFLGNFLQEFNPLNKLPIVKDFLEIPKAILNVLGADVYGNDQRTFLFQWSDSLVKGFQIICDKISGEDTNYQLYGGIYRLLQAVSGMTGIPLSTSARTVVNTWNATVATMAPSLKVKQYDAGDEANIKYAYFDGYLTAEEAIFYMQQDAGKSADEAEEKVNRWRCEVETDIAYDDLDEVYNYGRITREEVVSYLQEYGGKDLDEAEATVNRWDFMAQSDNIGDISSAAVANYNKYCKQSGIDEEVYYSAWKYCNSVDGDDDSDGETVKYSVVDKKLDYINRLPLTARQKKCLALAIGIGEKTISNRAKW